MERYLLFAWSQYYPRGGFNDLVGDYESEELAREQWESLSNREWGQIVDINTGQTWDL